MSGARRSIDPDWCFVGDDETPARYIRQLADALWRYEHAGNWATLGALVVACGAVFGDEFSRNELDTNSQWRLDDVAEPKVLPSGALPGGGVGGNTHE